MPTKKWTEEEEEFLKSNYVKLSNTELAEKFDITKNAVQKKLARMGLKRTQPPEELPLEEEPEIDDEEEEVAEAISTESQFFMANVLYHEERDYEQAIEKYRQAIEEESNELIKLKARYWMAEACVKIGNIEDALGIFGKLAKEHGRSYLGDSAKRRLTILKDYENMPRGNA